MVEHHREHEFTHEIFLLEQKHDGRPSSSVKSNTNSGIICSTITLPYKYDAPVCSYFLQAMSAQLSQHPPAWYLRTDNNHAKESNQAGFARKRKGRWNGGSSITARVCKQRFFRGGGLGGNVLVATPATNLGDAAVQRARVVAALRQGTYLKNVFSNAPVGLHCYWWMLYDPRLNGDGLLVWTALSARKVDTHDDECEVWC